LRSRAKIADAPDENTIAPDMVPIHDDVPADNRVVVPLIQPFVDDDGERAAALMRRRQSMSPDEMRRAGAQFLAGFNGQAELPHKWHAFPGHPTYEDS
jgi:hypothetical protein